MAKTNPGIKAVGIAAAFRTRIQRIDDAAVKQPEIAGAGRQARHRHRRKNLVEGLAGELPSARSPFPSLAYSIDHVEAGTPARDEGLDQLRGMLQVGVHQHDGLPAGVS